jgi:hypothetical protein
MLLLRSAQQLSIPHHLPPDSEAGFWIILYQFVLFKQRKGGYLESAIRKTWRTGANGATIIEFGMLQLSLETSLWQIWPVIPRKGSMDIYHQQTQDVTNAASYKEENDVIRILHL